MEEAESWYGDCPPTTDSFLSGNDLIRGDSNERIELMTKKVQVI